MLVIPNRLDVDSCRTSQLSNRSFDHQLPPLGIIDSVLWYGVKAVLVDFIFFSVHARAAWHASLIGN